MENPRKRWMVTEDISHILKVSGFTTWAKLRPLHGYCMAWLAAFLNQAGAEVDKMIAKFPREIRIDVEKKQNFHSDLVGASSHIWMTFFQKKSGE